MAPQLGITAESRKCETLFARRAEGHQFRLSASVEMSHDYRTSIPASATELIEQSFETGAKQQLSYILNDEQVGFQLWG